MYASELICALLAVWLTGAATGVALGLILAADAECAAHGYAEGRWSYTRGSAVCWGRLEEIQR